MAQDTSSGRLRKRCSGYWWITRDLKISAVWRKSDSNGAWEGVGDNVLPKATSPDSDGKYYVDEKENQ